MNVESVREKNYFSGMEEELLTLLLERGWTEEDVHNFLNNRRDQIPSKLALVMEAIESVYDLRKIEEELVKYAMDKKENLDSPMVVNHDVLHGIYRITHEGEVFAVINYNRLKLDVRMWLNVDNKSNIYINEDDVTMFLPINREIVSGREHIVFHFEGLKNFIKFLSFLNLIEIHENKKE